MDFTTDVHVEAANIQEQIEEHLGLKGKGLVFEFSRDKEHIKLDLITVNPRHNQSFLFHSVIGFDKIDALKRMFAYVKRYRKKKVPILFNGPLEVTRNCIHLTLVLDIFMMPWINSTTAGTCTPLQYLV